MPKYFYVPSCNMYYVPSCPVIFYDEMFITDCFKAWDELFYCFADDWYCWCNLSKPFIFLLLILSRLYTAKSQCQCRRANYLLKMLVRGTASFPKIGKRGRKSISDLGAFYCKFFLYVGLPFFFGVVSAEIRRPKPKNCVLITSLQTSWFHKN